MVGHIVTSRESLTRGRFQRTPCGLGQRARRVTCACTCAGVEPSSSAYRWPRQHRLRLCHALAPPPHPQHSGTLRQRDSSCQRNAEPCRIRQSTTCFNAIALLCSIAGGTSISTHARTEHTPSPFTLEVLPPLSETHPTRASLVGLATDYSLPLAGRSSQHGEDPDRARGPDCAPRQPAPS